MAFISPVPVGNHISPFLETMLNTDFSQGIHIIVVIWPYSGHLSASSITAIRLGIPVMALRANRIACSNGDIPVGCNPLQS